MTTPQIIIYRAGDFVRQGRGRKNTIILRNCLIYPMKQCDFCLKCLKTLLDFLGNIRYNGIKVG
jgi:hypothetical protein